MRLREGTKGKICYASISGFPKYGVRVSDQITLNNVSSGELFVANLEVTNNGTNFKDCDFSQTTSTLDDSWFINDITIGSGTEWMIGWTK